MRLQAGLLSVAVPVWGCCIFLRLEGKIANGVGSSLHSLVEAGFQSRTKENGLGVASLTPEGCWRTVLCKDKVESGNSNLVR
jgi:hypothetical protein